MNDDKSDEITEEEALIHNKQGVIYVLKKDSAKVITAGHNPCKRFKQGDNVQKSRIIYRTDLRKEQIEGIDNVTNLVRERRAEREQMRKYEHNNSLQLQNNELDPERRRLETTEDTYTTTTNPWSSTSQVKENEKHKHETAVKSNGKTYVGEPESSNERQNETRGSERDEILKRKNNIVIQALNEHGEKGDIDAILEINQVMGNQNFIKCNILNIGRIGEKRNDYPRPLRVEFDSQITKLNIMRNANHLKSNDKYSRLSIQHDLTRGQAYQFRKLKEESKRVEEQDPNGNWRYRVRGPPGRWQIIRFPKN